MRSISSLSVIAFLIGMTGSPGRAAGAVEHGNVAFDVSPDGKRIVFSSADGDLYLFHIETRQVDRLTSTRETESSPSFSPDGRSVVFSTINDNKADLAILDLDGKRVRAVTNLKGVDDSSPAFSRDGKRITFLRAHRLRGYAFGGSIWDDYDIYVINADGSEPRRLTQVKYIRSEPPHFAADGKSVIYSGTTNNYPAPSLPPLLEVDTEDKKPPHLLGPEPDLRGKGIPNTNTIRMGAWVSDPNISPDGKSIAFISDRAAGFSYDLFVMKRDGTDAKPLGLTNISRYNQKPVFLPDGKGILFLAGTEQNFGGRYIFSLWRVDVDGKNARRIADSGLFTNPKRWKPKP